MKKAFCAVLLGLIICAVPSLYAQDRDQESEYYYVSVPIEKIFAHKDGYMVSYRKFSNQLATMYIPMEWFTESTGKGDLIVTGSGSWWPNMVLYYKAGEFSHVRLTVRRDKRHETWGTVPLYMDLSDKFQGVDALYLEY